ncbi:protein NRT1/ PTR FAMILY 4.5-like [Apium graveolens]|uniref:protein NRT1/ PTR FAMILY 4.5-like n=1 Tax=Apium graveolens TaxID=4045 RepID=UPI003D7BC2B0
MEAYDGLSQKFIRSQGVYLGETVWDSENYKLELEQDEQIEKGRKKGGSMALVAEQEKVKEMKVEAVESIPNSRIFLVFLGRIIQFVSVSKRCYMAIKSSNVVYCILGSGFLLVTNLLRITDVENLIVAPISKASTRQRVGRAGREPMFSKMILASDELGCSEEILTIVVVLSIQILLINQCEAAESSQAAILYTGLYLVAFGAGGLKVALPSLGADQFDESDPEESNTLSSFFNWFLFFVVIGAIFGVTFLVWISENEGWNWGFGVSTFAVAITILFMCMGRSLYRNNVPKGSPLSRIMQVFVTAIRNRNLSLPENAVGFHEVHDKQSETLHRTNQFRFLDHAAVIVTTDSSTVNNPGPWKICTVTQVEETKILIRMLSIILSTIFMNTCLAQLQTFSIQQSNTMDINLLGFQVPGSSIPDIPLVFMFILIPIYDRVCVPILRKFTGIPTGVTNFQRIGVGLVLSAISMVVAGIVETHRKSVAVEYNMVDSAEPLPMIVFWLGFQYAIFGMADMFTL